jgi:hypothetical protein
MLTFERDVVAALSTTESQVTQSAVEAFVDGSLRAMPAPMRLGVMGESVVFAGYAGLLRATGRLDDPDGLRHLLDRWEASPIGPIRLYVRLFRSLVLLSENELMEEAA